MKYPVLFYFLEIKWKVFYLFLSILISLNVFFIYLQSLLLFNLFPILVYTKKRFISLNVTELFFILILFILYITFLCNINQMKRQVLLFLSPSWHKIQKTIFNTVFFLFWITFCFLLIITHLFILPKIFSFFAFWEIKKKYFLLHIEIEPHIQSYMYWILKTNFSFVTLQTFLLFIIVINLLFIKLIYVYIQLLKNKKYIYFFLCIIFSFFLNLDFSFLFSFLIIFLLFFELTLFLIIFLLFLQIIQ